MSVTAGDLTAYLRLDDSQFNAGVDGAGRKFGGLKASIGAGAKVIAGGLTTAATSAGVLGVALFKVGADYNRLQQNSRAALSTLLGGTKAANAQMDKLDAFATKSPFAKQVFITAQQQLLGFGVTAKNVIPILDGVQNAVAAVGGSNDDVSSITYALAQMQGQGKLTGETLNQLGQYGIDAAGILGKELGKTGAEIRDLASKPGGIPVDQVFTPLVDGMMKRFGGATDGIKQQMDGATDRIKGAWRDIGSAIAAPFIDPKGGGRAVEWANKVADLLRAVQQKVEPLVDLLVKRFGPEMGKITGYMDRARGAINNWDLSKVNGQLDRLTKYTPLISGAAAALFAFGSGSIPVLGKFLPAINPVVAGIGALVATSPALRGVVRDLGSGLSPLQGILKSTAKGLADIATEAIAKLTPALDTLATNIAPVVVHLARDLEPILLTTGQALAEVATEVVGELAPALLGLVQTIGPLVIQLASGLVPAIVAAVGVAADLVSWIAQLPTPVLVAAAAFALFMANLGTLKGGVGLMKDGLQSVNAALQTFRERMAVQSALAAMEGNTSKLAGAMGTASIAVRGLGAAMKGALIASGVGIAIAAVTAAIGFLVEKQQSAKAAAEAQRQVVDDLTQAFITSKGAIDANVRSIAAQHLQTLKFGDTGKSAADVAQQLGINLYDLGDAWLMQGNALDVLLPKLKQVQSAGTTWNSQGQIVMTGDALAAQWLAEQLRGAAGASDESRTGAAQATEIIEKNTTGTDANTTATQVNTAAKKDAAGIALSQREAELAQADAQDAVTDAIKRAKEVRADERSSKKDVAAADRDVEKALLRTIDTYSQTRESMINNNVSAKKVTEEAENQRAAFIKSAEAAGFSTKKAERLADKYGLIPADIRTDIVANTDKAIERTNALSSLIEGAGLDLTKWKIAADGKTAINTANGTVATINAKTGEITISGDDADALKRAGIAVTEIGGKKASITIDADTTLADTALARLMNNTDYSNYIVVGGKPVYSFGTDKTKKPKNPKNHKATGGGVFGEGTSTSDSILAALSNGEHVWTAREVQALGGHREVERLRKAVLDGKIPAFAAGGRVGSLGDDRVTWARGHLSDAQDSLNRAKAESKAASKSKDDKRATRASKALDAARQEVSDWKDEVARLVEQERTTRTDVRRRNIRKAVTGGLDSAYGVVDQLDEWSRNKDLSKKQRKGLASEAASAEKSLKGLYKNADATAKALEKAKDNLAALKDIRDGIAGNLAGEFSLAGLVTESKDAGGWTSKNVPTAKGMVAAANSKVAAIKSLTGKLDKLAALGLTGVILQEIAGEGTETGNLMADALLADTSQIFGLNRAYADIAKYSAAAGTAATKNTTIGGTTYAGGIADADSEVKGLNGSLDKTNAKIRAIGKTLESTLLGALGLKLNAKGQVVKKAGGGWITGGTPGVDSVDLSAMPDEFVMRATQARKYPALLEAMNSGADLSRFLTVQMPVGAAAPAGVTSTARSVDVTSAITKALSTAQIIVHTQVGLTDSVKAEVVIDGTRHAIERGAIINGRTF